MKKLIVLIVLFCCRIGIVYSCLLYTSSLLASGLDFSRSFRLLTEGETNKRIKSVLEEIHRSVIGGNALWQSLAQSGHFTPLDYGVVRIGEETGPLSRSLSFLSEDYRKRIASRRMISGEMCIRDRIWDYILT